MSMFENFPYTNFHELNLDWIIKIAKDFLDQYTNIQETISQGITNIENTISTGTESLEELTNSELAELQNKYDTLRNLLDAWYTTHSNDIADQLASALSDLNSWYTTHQNYLDQTLANNILAFNTACNTKAEETLESIPDDYTALSNHVLDLDDELVSLSDAFKSDFFYTEHELVFSILHNNYAINRLGTLEQAPGYAVYGADVLPWIGERIFLHVTTNGEYKCCFATDAGITHGFVGFAESFIEIPATATGLYITTQNISIDGASVIIKRKISDSDCEFIFSKNMFNKATATIGKYVNQNNGELADNANFFVSDYIPIEGNQQYVMSAYGMWGSRYATYDFDKDYISGAIIGSTDPITTPALARYIRISTYKDQLDTVQFEKGSVATNYVPYANKIDDKLLPANRNMTIGNGFAKTTGNISTGQSLTLFTNNIKKNNVYNFTAKITSFGSLIIGHGTNQYESSFVTITPTNIDYTEITPYEYTVQHTHGLTINTFIHVLIEVKNRTAHITLSSNSGTYEFDTQWDGSSNAYPYVKCVSGALSECVFTWSCADFIKPLWVIGDSYVQFIYDMSWCYYMNEHGYLKNILLNGFGGETSEQALAALVEEVEYGKPEAIIWALGLNDGTDTADDPNANWLSGVEEFINICTNKGIEPILCTLPTVPSVNNEQKNSYVRSSGYRYIDFAKAVGATDAGIWYDDMLSTDYVHPTAKGALALFERAITDIPELTY